MTTEDQLQLPHLEGVGADTVPFARLDVDDLVAWAAEVKSKRVADERTRLNNDPDMKGKDELRQKMIQGVALQEVEFGNLFQRTYTPLGAKKALVISLKKGGKGDAETLAILKRIHFTRQCELAQIVMSPPTPEMVEDEKSPPLAESDTDATGGQSEQH